MINGQKAQIMKKTVNNRLFSFYKRNYSPIVKEAPMGGLWRKCLWQGCQSQAYRDVFTASSGTDYP